MRRGAGRRCAPAALDWPLLGGRSTSPLGAVRPNGHFIFSLGVAVRVNWAWLFRLRQTAEDSRAAGLRRCPDDLPVFRVEHRAARHTGAGDYCYSILCQNVTARLTIVAGVRERRRKAFTWALL